MLSVSTSHHSPLRQAKCEDPCGATWAAEECSTASRWQLFSDGIDQSRDGGGDAIFDVVCPGRGDPAPQVRAAALVAAFLLDAAGGDVAVHVVAVAGEPNHR